MGKLSVSKTPFHISDFFTLPSWLEGERAQPLQRGIDYFGYAQGGSWFKLNRTLGHHIVIQKRFAPKAETNLFPINKDVPISPLPTEVAQEEKQKCVPPFCWGF